MAHVHAGRVIAQALAREGVRALFTLCGGHIMPIYDGCLDEGIRVVDVRHEQAAVYAADAYARITRRPGVAAVTAGPGVMNAVTAIANAHRAQSPVVILGGQGPLEHAGRGSLQEMDHLGVVRPITKWAVQVQDPKRLPEILNLAFRRSLHGVPGPVYVEIPLDVVFAQVDLEGVRFPAPVPGRSALPADPREVERAAAVLRRARRPVALVGSQVHWSPDPQAVSRFAEAAQVPVFTNGMARGVLAAGDPFFFQLCRKQALAEADVVLVAGTPLDFRLDYGQAIRREARIVQIDLDPGELGRNRDVEAGLAGDTATVLDQLLEAGLRPDEPAERRQWLDRLREEEGRRAARMQAGLTSHAVPVDPLRLCAEIDAALPPGATVIGDGGDFIGTAAKIVRPRRYPAGWLDPGPLGTLGVGMGFALAARVLRPDDPVVVLLGDGAAGLDLLEYEAAVRLDLPFVAVVGNDAAWTQIRRLQVQLFGTDRAVATQLSYARYDQVVAALGGHGEWVERPEEVRPAIERALASGRPALVNVKMGVSDFRAGAIAV
ncbi:thiamine pyrophosphate-binding protein [Thermaerobacter subterraneus]|uniref:Thiamine pyrophosphate-dependent enzyme, putative carboligase or decarboxylase n=1 Tax=Thermaerobacter subterraneus DSM 13965 TaxID=867903 RepID=K6P3Z8_9FIRM|nr:thiamine pyrophosphate-binding protein [Thermaerobacter subterraneus]EKP95775.1 thiamine pyrophosphate-dependent enzyme, putative carboligase or decarboxylase [Thermaerobacter subterraneus DSM 13965]